MTTPINSFQDILDAMERDLGRLVRMDFRDKLAPIADRLARRNLALLNPRVVMWAGGEHPMSPLPEVDQAAERGNITWEEADDLVLADVIVRATREDGLTVYVVAEISITVQERDRVRAQRRAALLEKATGVATIPVVIGIDEETPVEPSGVEFIQFDPDE